MKCPHCGDNFHDDWSQGHLNYKYEPTGWFWGVTKCASSTCGEFIILLGTGPALINGAIPAQIDYRAAYPTTSSRGPIPAEVPIAIRDDYKEASDVLPISPKASAALARRCLQNVLHSQGYKDRDLFREINKLIDEKDPRKAIPESLRTVIDGIRHFGNFSAHPITDTSSLQIIDVEPHEADWCLDILDELFEHFYVKPAQAMARKAKLDAKLAAAGKLPSK